MKRISQLFLDFQAGIRGSLAERALQRPLYATPDEADPQSAPVKAKAKKATAAETTTQFDETLTEQCRQILHALDLSGAVKLVSVQWNPRLRSTAGYANYPSWRIELNPKLQEFEGQVNRTVLHELAHLVAYHRAGRKKIEPHGVEWQRACVDVGIPGESARHTLPLPRREVKRPYTYACAHCGLKVKRVRKFRRGSACKQCCTQFTGGVYDSRFRFVLIEDDSQKA